MTTKKTLILIAILWCHIQALAQVNTEKDALTRILFIYDASNSMNGTWQSGKKHLIAQKLISQALDSLAGVKHLEIALRVYGHQHYYLTGQNCDDTKLEVPFAPNNIEKIKAKLRKIEAKGTTPIAQTLEKCETDFPPCANCRNIIILITDGIEECNGDPCAIAQALQRKGIVLKPFVIGVGLDMQFKKTFECVGTYFDAANEQSFKDALRVVISQALNNTTTQVNLIDAYGNATETDVTVTFAEHYSQKSKYNLVHTLDLKGNPDTLTIEPLFLYDVIAHTIPSVRKDSVYITPGIHNIIGLNTPQGALVVRTSGVSKDTYPVIVKQADSNRILHHQNLGEKVKYITGKYDLEVLTTPRISILGVEISQSKTTTVEIPTPGIASISRPSSGIADIFKVSEEGLTWVYKLDPQKVLESVKLLPGDYLVVNKPINAKSADFTVTKSFSVREGSSITVKIY